MIDRPFRRIQVLNGSPSVVREVRQITLCEGEGNFKPYVPGRKGVDRPPPRLLGIKIGTA